MQIMNEMMQMKNQISQMMQALKQKEDIISQQNMKINQYSGNFMPNQNTAALKLPQQQPQPIAAPSGFLANLQNIQNGYSNQQMPVGINQMQMQNMQNMQMNQNFLGQTSMPLLK
jgi:hypothetical protein